MPKTLGFAEDEESYYRESMIQGFQGELYIFRAKFNSYIPSTASEDFYKLDNFVDKVSNSLQQKQILESNPWILEHFYWEPRFISKRETPAIAPEEPEECRKILMKLLIMGVKFS